MKKIASLLLAAILFAPCAFAEQIVLRTTVNSFKSRNRVAKFVLDQANPQPRFVRIVGIIVDDDCRAIPTQSTYSEAGSVGVLQLSYTSTTASKCLAATNEEAQIMLKQSSEVFQPFIVTYSGDKSSVTAKEIYVDTNVLGIVFETD